MPRSAVQQEDFSYSLRQARASPHRQNFIPLPASAFGNKVPRLGITPARGFGQSGALPLLEEEVGRFPGAENDNGPHLASRCFLWAQCPAKN